ncbi:MAG: nucleotide pyrophosphohydrolase [Bdellovibrionales bacterium]|nr:nucleotide pyrophosphohydrolase [Bdellovibrionales bacterium]
MNELKVFADERDWDQFHSVKNLSMALNVEASELLEIFQWLTEEQSNNAKNDQKLKRKASEEVADIFIYLMRVVSKLEINLDEAIQSKLKKNAEKYPVNLAKGNAKKYNELK